MITHTCWLVLQVLQVVLVGRAGLTHHLSDTSDENPADWIRLCRKDYRSRCYTPFHRLDSDASSRWEWTHRCKSCTWWLSGLGSRWEPWNLKEPHCQQHPQPAVRETELTHAVKLFPKQPNRFNIKIVLPPLDSDLIWRLFSSLCSRLWPWRWPRATRLFRWQSCKRIRAVSSAHRFPGGNVKTAGDKYWPGRKDERALHTFNVQLVLIGLLARLTHLENNTRRTNTNEDADHRTLVKTRRIQMNFQCL